MYIILRWYKTKPGQAHKVATLVFKQAAAYRDAGRRSEFRVSYNRYTLPGDHDVVGLERTDDALRTPNREVHDLPKEAPALGGQVRELTQSQRIEFPEMLTPEKFQE